MTYDPNDKNPELRPKPDLNPNVPPYIDPNLTPPARSTPSWVPFGAVIVLILAGVFIWSQMGGPTTDPTTTSSTASPPAVSEQAPAVEPMAPTTPATPPANDAAPATPAPGGTTTTP